jgi:hypothetical protein
LKGYLTPDSAGHSLRPAISSFNLCFSSSL